MAAAAAPAAAGATGASSGGTSSGLGSTFASAGMSVSGTVINDMLQNYYNKKAATKNYERTLDFWNKQNAYNSPKAQMERFAQAGLNPALMYSQGNSGNAGPIGDAPVPTFRVPNPNFLDRMASIIALENAKKQGELIDTQKSALDQKIVESQAKIVSMDYSGNLNYLRGQDLAYRLAGMAEGQEGGSPGPYYRDLYKTQMDSLKMRLQLMAKDMQIRSADLLLKQDVHTEKAYYNYLRTTLGVEKGDNIFIRAGMGLYNQARRHYENLPQLTPTNYNQKRR